MSLSWQEELLTEILGCGSLDLEVLEDYLNLAEGWDLEVDITNLIQALKDYGTIDFNTLLYEVMKFIVEELAYKVFEDYEKVNFLLSHFDPFLNYLDSSFNNPLDEAKTKEEAEAKLKEWYETLKKEQEEEQEDEAIL